MTKHLYGNVRQFVGQWPCKEVTIKQYGMGSGERSEAVMKISRTATNVWTLLAVKKTFILVDENWFRTYVTYVLGSAHYCHVR